MKYVYHIHASRGAHHYDGILTSPFPIVSIKEYMETKVNLAKSMNLPAGVSDSVIIQSLSLLHTLDANGSLLR